MNTLHGELALCPFCGETPSVRHGWAFCFCNAMAPLQAWNRRHPAPTGDMVSRLIVEIEPIPDADGGGFNACIPERGRWTMLGDGATEAEALRDLANCMEPPAPDPGMREAAQAMLDAVELVDNDGELDSRIDGTLIDNLRAALTRPPAEKPVEGGKS